MHNDEYHAFFYLKNWCDLFIIQLIKDSIFNNNPLKQFIFTIDNGYE